MVEIWPSAYKHSIERDDILHAWRNQVRYVQLEYDGEVQLLVIGPGRTGVLLELVIPTGEPQRIIHADLLRPKFHSYLPCGGDQGEERQTRKRTGRLVEFNRA